MANKIELDIVLNTADSASSLKDIKQSLKELKNAALEFDPGSEGFIKATKKAGELEDKLNDVKDGIKSFNASPLENVIGSFGRLGNKIASLDFGGAKAELSALGTSVVSLGKSILGLGPASTIASVAMRSLGAAIAATGIGALVIAIVLLITNFDKLKESGGFVGDAIKKVGEIITSVTNKIKAFTDALGLTDFAGTELKKKTEENNKKIVESNKKAAEEKKKIAEKEATEAEKLEDKQKAAREKAAEDKKRAQEKAAQDELKLREQLSDAIIGSIASDRERQIAEIQNTLNDKINAIKGNGPLEIAARAAIEAETRRVLFDLDTKFEAEDKKKADDKLKSDQDAIKTREEEAAKLKADKEAADKEKADKEKQLEKETQDAKFQIASNFVDSASGLNDLLFSIETANLKKGSAEFEKAAKRNFNINKGLAIANAVISGIQGIQNALTAQSILPEPIATALRVSTAVAIGIASAANIAKIASSQYTSTATGGGAAASTPSVPQASTSNIQEVRPSDFSLFGTAGKANNLGSSKSTEVRAYVLESDITSTQKKLQHYKTASEL